MLALSALGLTWLTACQAGPTQFEPAPPPLRLVASEPSAGEGTECTTAAPPECGVPINSSITLRFDRYLRASTAVRQSISVYAGSPANGVGLLRPEYDVVERVLVYRLTQPLEPGTLYTVELLSANSSAALGFQAFDGAPLDDGAAPVKFSFFTRRNREFAPVLPLEPISSCDRILEIFASAGCSASGCHGGAIPSTGLLLDRAESIVQTAVDRAARQTELGAVVGVPLQDPVRFGLQMPIIDPGQPANSYLLYKLFRGEFSHWLGPDDPGRCTSRYSVALGPDCVPPSESELTRLREWFVRGSAMPPPVSGSSDAPGSAGAPNSAPPEVTLFRPELREIQRFIAGGAICQ